MKSAYLHPPKGGFHRVAISSTLVDFIRIADFIAVLRTAKLQFINTYAKKNCGRQGTRRKQGEGVVTYVEPLSRSNAVSRNFSTVY